MRRPPEEPLSLPALREVDTAPLMRIGEVAARLGLSLRSVRYYEEEGLVEASGRTPGGFRLYSELDVQRLLLIMAAMLNVVPRYTAGWSRELVIGGRSSVEGVSGTLKATLCDSHDLWYAMIGE